MSNKSDKPNNSQVSSNTTVANIFHSRLLYILAILNFLSPFIIGVGVFVFLKLIRPKPNTNIMGTGIMNTGFCQAYEAWRITCDNVTIQSIYYVLLLLLVVPLLYYGHLLLFRLLNKSSSKVCFSALSVGLGICLFTTINFDCALISWIGFSLLVAYSACWALSTSYFLNFGRTTSVFLFFLRFLGIVIFALMIFSFATMSLMRGDKSFMTMPFAASAIASFVLFVLNWRLEAKARKEATQQL